ncbi:uncharacterized protein LOC133191383 [Saccostrea echinata]|uniref:uncharacterized protein LOC133191383 n=1 Tax=Saccostrea echinata TaxID=191078 RepID=UPI002A83A506|nr:uncharacterized protein LOC133191383 [Saccostrea echinata]
MDPAERQALHNVKEELQNCAVITDKMLVHFLQNQKITKAEKYELSRLGANCQRVKRILQIMKNRKEPLKTLTETLLLDVKNDYIVQKLRKKVRFCRKRLQAQENQTSSYFGQLDDVADILYTRGYLTIYGESRKVTAGTSHQALVEDINKFVGDITKCRQSLEPSSERQSFQEIIAEYKEKKHQEIENAKLVCAKLVKSKNSDLEEKQKNIKDLQDELMKLKVENESMRKKMGIEIKTKVQENVDRLLMLPRLSPTDPVPYVETEEDILDRKLRQRSPVKRPEPQEHSLSDSESDCESDSDVPASNKMTTSTTQKGSKIVHNYNIYNNHMYSDTKIYQN